MSDFMDMEAEESNSEMSSASSDEEKVRVKKKKKAVLSDVDSSEEDEEEDEEQAKKEMQGFIDDNPDEAEESGSDSDTGGKKRKHSEDEDDNSELEEDDLDLIEDNLGIKLDRKKRLKRVKVDSSDEEEEADDRQKLEHELFDDDADAVSTTQEEPTVPDEMSGSEDDQDDFVVDDEEGRARQRRPKIHADEAMQEAQDIFGVDFDYDEFEGYGEDQSEEEDLYSDEEPEAPRRKQVTKRRQKAKTIFEVYEPSELERSHLTEKDSSIRSTDMPERFQLRGTAVQSAETAELEEEALWIYRQSFMTSPLSTQDIWEESRSTYSSANMQKDPGTITKIRNAIDMMRNENLEVPFIAFYRKEAVLPELNINDLWRIWQWDEKWMQLRERKQNLRGLYMRMQRWHTAQLAEEDVSMAVREMRAVSEQDVRRAEKVQTFDEWKDVYTHFALYYGRQLPNMQKWEKEERRKERERIRREKEEAGEAVESDDDEEDVIDPGSHLALKHASRKALYHACVDSHIGDLCKRFGLTSSQFAENLRDNYTRHDVEQWPDNITQCAEQFVCNRFKTTSEVLAAGRYVLATQIASEPEVRHCVRQVYFERAKISVKPTKKGLKEIDESSSVWRWKYLRDKPVREMCDEEYLLLHQAQQDNLLTINIHLEPSAGGSMITDYLNDVQHLFQKDEFSAVAQEWNDERKKVLEQAFVQLLYPQFRRELHSRLLEEASEAVVRACARRLYGWLRVAPFHGEQQEDEEDCYLECGTPGCRVLAIAFDPAGNNTAQFGAMLDLEGEVLDYVRLPDILKRRNSYRRDEAEAKERDLGRVRALIEARRPHVVAICGESREALMLLEDIEAVCRDSDLTIPVHILDNNLSTVFSSSKRAEMEFREYPQLLKQAVSLGRRLQDPLIEFAQLCNADDDILCLQLHPQQELVNKDELRSSLYLEFVNRVSEVGVDVNRCLSHAHTQPLLQFVGGLGPRKAAQLIKSLKQKGKLLLNRTQLVTYDLTGPKVFVNCVGFLKINTANFKSSEEYVEVLDGSRIHPETYDWARKMAVDALDYDDTNEDADPAAALDEILENPERLKDLDLDAFAEELQRQGYGNKQITLYDIRAELNHRYKDQRTAYRPPTAEELFNMLTKETQQTFYCGKMILCKVTGFAYKKPGREMLDEASPVRNEETGLWECPFCRRGDFVELSDVWSHFDAGNCPGSAVGVKTRLDNGVTGFIPTRSISDKRVESPEQRVKVNMVLNARIVKIDVQRYQVELTSRTSDLSDVNGQYRPAKDTYYDYDEEKKVREQEEQKQQQKAKQMYTKRVILHPSFQNISYTECEQKLRDMDQGDVIIRPSRKGDDHLTVTWKVADGILQHIDVIEQGKENSFSLGKSLLIGNEEFEDLDEIIARHVQPIASFARDILQYKYYKEFDSKEAIEATLKADKQKQPSRIPYYLTVVSELPGKFLLSYLPRNKIRHEYVTPTTSGFRYRQRPFTSVNSLLKYFKEHFREPPPGTPHLSSRTPGASRTPGVRATPRVSGTPMTGSSRVRATPGATPQVRATPRATPGATPQITPRTAVFQTPQITPAIVTPQNSGGTRGSLTTPQYQPTPQSARPTPKQTPTPRAGGSRPDPQTDWAAKARLWAKQQTNERTHDSTPLLDEP